MNKIKTTIKYENKIENLEFEKKRKNIKKVEKIDK